MKKSRRSFIKTGAVALVGATMMNKELFASAPKKGIVGLQLYSIRDEMRKDPFASLKEVARMGYMYVEHANYVDGKFYGYVPKEFRKVLDDVGLKMISGHTVFDKTHWDASKKDF